MNKMPEFYMIFARKYFLPNFGGQIPALKLRMSRFYPKTNNGMDHGGHLSTGAIVLNKLFMHLPTLLYSISLGA